jgi:hypothetical protein
MGQATQLVTLTEWLRAPRKTRKAALRFCLDRVRSMDSSIHAWVQVQPQHPIGHGKLTDIPIYKGRIGTVDAAIVRDLRQRGAILLGKTCLPPEQIDTTIQEVYAALADDRSQ